MRELGRPFREGESRETVRLCRRLALANPGIEKLRFLDRRRCDGRTAPERFPSRLPFRKATRGIDFDRPVSRFREIPAVAGDKSRAARCRACEKIEKPHYSSSSPRKSV